MKCYGQYSFLRVLFLKYLLPVYILFCVFEVVRAQCWIDNRPLIQQSVLNFLFKFQESLFGVEFHHYTTNVSPTFNGLELCEKES